MWSEPILHVDMDSFFVEIERLENPRLVGKPVAVGGTGPRGVVASASYEARRFGVRSAQPTATALRMCPQLIVVPPSHGRYSEASVSVFALFRSVTPLVEGLSLDEAFLDVSGLRLHHESPAVVGEMLRSRIRSELGLPASVGVAANKLLAKLASEAAKPDGLRYVPVDTQLAFLHSLPAESLWGVGPATLAGLMRLGVRTVGDIAEIPVDTLAQSIGPTAGPHLHDLANGLDNRPVEPDGEAKSISVEQTYDVDLMGEDVIESALLDHAHRLSGRLRRSGLAARTVNLKIRYEDFTTYTRSHTHDGGLQGARELFQVGKDLLGQVDSTRPVRLLGLGGSGLEKADLPRQMDIKASQEWDQVEDAVAEVRDRYGDNAVKPARLVRKPQDQSKNPVN